MPASAEALFAWHARPGAFARLMLPWDPIELLERTPGLEVGSRTAIRMRLGPIPQRWVAVHTRCEPGVLFEDTQLEGPFRAWKHTHRVVPVGPEASELSDEVEYSLPVPPLGGWLAAGHVQRTLARMFRYRHALTAADLARHAVFAQAPRQAVGVVGTAGPIGVALASFLDTGGHQVVSLDGEGSSAAPEGLDALVLLEGSPLEGASARAGGDVSALVKRFAALRAPPKVAVCASSSGIYGEGGEEWLEEGAPLGSTELALRCIAFEAALAPLRARGVRVVFLRCGQVVTAAGGLLDAMRSAATSAQGAAGPSGQKRLSWVSLEDVLGLMYRFLFDASVEGAVNAVAPGVLRREEVAAVVGRVLPRPTPWRALRTALGTAGDSWSVGQRVRSQRGEVRAFRFLHPTLEETLRFTLGR